MLRFGTVGTGWIASEYVRGALDSGLWTLTAVYSRSAEKGMAFGAPFGCPRVFTDLNAFADWDGMDAVYIASPNALHVEQARLMLEHGKHVLCEKPVAARAEEVRALQALARRRGLVFMEAIMYLHLPQRGLLKDSVNSLGGVSFAKLDFCQRSSKLDALLAGELPNIFNPEMETGALMDLGVYCLYPALDLFGRPERFTAELQKLPTGVDGSGSITLVYPDKLVSLTFSKLGQAGANSDFQGPAGTLSVGSISRLADMSLWRPDGTVTALYGGDEKAQLMGWEAKDFARAITAPTETQTELLRWNELSLAVAELMEQIRRSAGVLFPRDGQ